MSSGWTSIKNRFGKKAEDGQPAPSALQPESIEPAQPMAAPAPVASAQEEEPIIVRPNRALDTVG